MVVGIVDDVEQFAGLGQEGSYFAIRPPRNDTFAVMRKGNREAFQPRHLYSQQLLSILCIPDPNLIGSSSGKHLRVVIRKRNIIDALVMAGISEFRSEGGRVYPVDVGLGGACEEVGVVAGEGD